MQTSPYRLSVKRLSVLAYLASEFINDKDRIQNSGLYTDFDKKEKLFLNLIKKDTLISPQNYTFYFN